MTELLETLLEEAFLIIKKARHGLPRRYSFPVANNMVKVAVGVRRSGKTYFLYQVINKLLDQGVFREQILFINFEDDRLLPMDAKQMGTLLDDFYTLYPENHDRQCYLFLDEVQNVENWYQVVRRYFDSKKVQIYLTGSSAKLLSKEINTSLRGRSLPVEILPYSFREYLDARKVSFETKVFGKVAFDKMRHNLLHYFETGGFPAVQSMVTNEWRETLQGYVNTVILRDIVERQGVSNIALLKYLTMSLLKSYSAPFSVNKFFNDVKSQGYKVGKETIHNYLTYIQDAFLLFLVPYYSESERLKQNRPRKVYAIDTGLVRAVSLEARHNYGRLLENLIYLDLRREKKTISYYNTQSGYEIDFVVVDPEGKRELIQVCWDSSDAKTMEREQRALKEAEKELGIPGRIITARDYLKRFA